MKGCTSGLGRCHVVNNYDKVDDECVKIENNCVLKNGLRRLDRLSRDSNQNIKNMKQKSDQILSGTHSNISAIVALGYTVYNGLKFYFLDERPINTENICRGSCSDFDHVFFTGKDNCMTSTALIYKLIKKYGEENVKVLLDYPKDKPDEIIKVLRQQNVDTKIVELFSSNIYEDIVLHSYNLSYTLLDVRQMKSIQNTYYSLVNPYLSLGRYQQTISRYILGQRVKKCTEIFMRAILPHISFNITELEEKYVRDTDTLIKFFYKSTDNNKSNFLKLFEVDLNTTDYLGDVQDIMLKLISPEGELIDEPLYVDLLGVILSHEYQHGMSYISYRLRQLELDHNFDIIDKILLFAANNLFLGNEHLNAWNSWDGLYHLYQQRRDGIMVANRPVPDAGTIAFFSKNGMYPLTSVRQIDGLVDVIYALTLLFTEPRELNIIHTYTGHYPDFRDFFTEYLGVPILKYPEELPEALYSPYCVSVDSSILPMD